ncbi:MAG: LysR family transcriptional regulator [Acidobacteria bacterium]|nr:LysR family transcriptional regulator [Acidobacteriota bacterium]
MSEPTLDLQQLRAFYAVLQAGGFSAAAHRLGRTQSAVSHAVRKLEDSAGLRLLDRRGRDLRPTEAGERLHRACEAVFSTLDSAQEELQRGRARAQGRIRLGATVEFGCSVLMQHIRPFLEAHPGIEMDFHLSHDLLTPLLREDIDLAIDCVEHPVPGLDRTPLFREAYMVACAPGYLAERGLQEPADLARCTVLSIDKACTWWERFLVAVPRKRRPAFGRVVAIDHIRGLINAAVNGLGVLLAPSYSLQGELARGALVPLFPRIRPLEDRFALYQKAGKARLAKHRLLKAYLVDLNPEEFGA